ncbi:hypothetical protein OC834_003441 [Tilletia horrida]|uniref:Cytochrome P450 n=1 Tax=Tilletia horrida TaxID=155126 RepID=A0AAN6GDY1_9BASI|nr:hypothetical protein OC835_006735 [Tilletia horrida]KAK0528171.1 hypothetical protein OC842_004629 [Tilletia horrida]KAK0530053.1 hypothetical protein OC834_003441 [Tilletia horrida]
MVDIDVLASVGRVDLVTAAQLGLVLFLLAVVLRPIVHFIRRPYASNLTVLPHEPVKHFFWGSWPNDAEVGGHFEKYLLKTIKQHGPVNSVTLMGRRPMIVVGDHRAANKFLLQTPYNRVPLINNIIRRHAGAGLLTTEGAQHRRQRKVAHPAFTMPAVYDMTPIFHEKAADLITRLRRKVAADDASTSKEYGSRVDIAKDLFSAALDIIGAAGFDYQFNSLLGSGETSALEKAFYDCLHLLTTGTLYSAMRALLNDPAEKAGRLLGIKEQAHLDNAKKLVDGISTELVKRAKASGTSGKDLLTLMVRANTSEELKDHQRLSDEELASLVPVFLFAGHETTATALSWSMLALVDRESGKRIQERLRKELTSDPSFAWRDSPSTLDSLPYLDSFTREVMRFYCPVRSLPRQVPYDDVLPLAHPIKLNDGTTVSEIKVKKHQTVTIPISWINRDESLWGPDGNVFKAERWLPAGHEFKGPESELDIDPSVKELRGVWSNLATFGAGPQQCIGVRMAIMEFKTLIAHLVTNFEFLPPSLPNEPPVEIDAVMEIVAHPTIKGDKSKELAMPVRLKALA